MTGSTRVDWTDEALRQLDRAQDYISLSNSEAVADRITEHVFATVQQLSRFPMSGRVGRVSGTRELVLSNTPFVAAYVIERERIAILAVYHGRAAVAGSFLAGPQARRLGLRDLC